MHICKDEKDDQWRRQTCDFFVCRMSDFLFTFHILSVSLWLNSNLASFDPAFQGFFYYIMWYFLFMFFFFAAMQALGREPLVGLPDGKKREPLFQSVFICFFFFFSFLSLFPPCQFLCLVWLIKSALRPCVTLTCCEGRLGFRQVEAIEE
jgi:hypothetical protein